MKHLFKISLGLIVVIGAFFLLRGFALGSDSGALSPGTMADDATVGTVAWANYNNATTSDNVYATATAGAGGQQILESSIKIVKADGTIGTTNKSTGAALPAEDTYVSYGSSSDLWGETWDDTKINDIDFGVVFSVVGNAGTSHYLKATNFGFSIPTGATINGILAEIEQKRPGNNIASVDHIRITVYYTEAIGAPQSVQIKGGNIQIRGGRLGI